MLKMHQIRRGKYIVLEIIASCWMAWKAIDKGTTIIDASGIKADEIILRADYFS